MCFTFKHSPTFNLSLLGYVFSKSSFESCEGRSKTFKNKKWKPYNPGSPNANSAVIVILEVRRIQGQDALNWDARV